MIALVSDNIKSLHRGGNSDGFSFFGPVNEVLVQNVLLVNVDNQIVLQAGLPTGPHKLSQRYTPTLFNLLTTQINYSNTFQVREE